jgi:hypothetical protein
MGENRCLKTKKMGENLTHSSRPVGSAPALAAAVLFIDRDLPRPSFLVFLGVRCALPFWKLVVAMHIFAILSF